MIALGGRDVAGGVELDIGAGPAFLATDGFEWPGVACSCDACVLIDLLCTSSMGIDCTGVAAAALEAGAEKTVGEAFRSANSVLEGAGGKGAGASVVSFPVTFFFFETLIVSCPESAA